MIIDENNDAFLILEDLEEMEPLKRIQEAELHGKYALYHAKEQILELMEKIK